MDGLTDSQRDALANPVKRTLSEPEQWYTVWDTLFPGELRPDTPYVSTNHFEETLSMIRAHWHRNRPRLVAGALGCQRTVASSQEDLRLSSLASHIVDSLLEDVAVAASRDEREWPAMPDWRRTEPSLVITPPSDGTGPLEMALIPSRPGHQLGGEMDSVSQYLTPTPYLEFTGPVDEAIEATPFISTRHLATPSPSDAEVSPLILCNNTFLSNVDSSPMYALSEPSTFAPLGTETTELSHARDSGIWDMGMSPWISLFGVPDSEPLGGPNHGP